jgi:hypothetical protein
MKKHTRIYLDYFGYCETDVIVCEIPNCRRLGVDLHHINARGMGGSKTKDVIENIMCVCREHHLEYGDKKQYKEYLKQIHLNHINDFKLTK